MELRENLYKMSVAGFSCPQLLEASLGTAQRPVDVKKQKEAEGPSAVRALASFLLSDHRQTRLAEAHRDRIVVSY